MGLSYFVKKASEQKLNYTGIDSSIECAIIRDTLVDYA